MVASGGIELDIRLEAVCQRLAKCLLELIRSRCDFRKFCYTSANISRNVIHGINQEAQSIQALDRIFFETKTASNFAGRPRQPIRSSANGSPMSLRRPRRGSARCAKLGGC